jgi:hypothetical protein
MFRYELCNFKTVCCFLLILTCMLLKYGVRDEAIWQLQVLDIIGECPEQMSTGSGIKKSSFYFPHKVSWRRRDKENVLTRTKWKLESECGKELIHTQGSLRLSSPGANCRKGENRGIIRKVVFYKWVLWYFSHKPVLQQSSSRYSYHTKQRQVWRKLPLRLSTTIQMCAGGLDIKINAYVTL